MTFLGYMESYLLLISAIASFIAALTGLLILRSRYGLPRIQAHILPRIQVVGASDLGGHFKTGQWWSPQKRPMGMARDSVVLPL